MNNNRDLLGKEGVWLDFSIALNYRNLNININSYIKNLVGVTINAFIVMLPILSLLGSKYLLIKQDH